MLSIKSGKPIAIVHGGEFDSEIIYITENKGEGGAYSEEDFDSEDYDSDEDFDTESEDDIDDKYFKIEDGVMAPLPNLETRQVTYIAGPSGSGKSTYAANLSRKYEKAYPDNLIYIFSRLDSDPAFDKNFIKKPVRIAIDNSLIEHPIDVTQQIKGGALVIFDDVDSLQDDKLKKEVQKLEIDILEIGRHNNIHIICCCHLVNPNDRKFGRTILNEAHSLTFFPKSGSTYQIIYCLKNYFGLSKKQIERLLALPSRWVTINRHFPMYVIYEGGVFLL